MSIYSLGVAHACVEGRGQLAEEELILFFHLVGLGAWTQFCQAWQQALCLLSHVSSPIVCLLYYSRCEAVWTLKTNKQKPNKQVKPSLHPEQLFHICLKPQAKSYAQWVWDPPSSWENFLVRCLIDFHLGSAVGEGSAPGPCCTQNRREPWIKASCCVAQASLEVTIFLVLFRCQDYRCVPANLPHAPF